MRKKTTINLILLALFVFAGNAFAFTESSSNNYFGTGAGAADGGVNNSFFGASAGNSNTGAYNTFIGRAAGGANTSGYDNTFIGASAGDSTTTGYHNTFIGSYAGQLNNGSYNTFLGANVGEDATGGSYNTFIGGYNGFYNSGSNNTFLGYRAGNNNTTGDSNTFLGYRAGNNNTTGGSNVFLGYHAGYNETGSNKLYIDNSNTSSPLIWGDFSSNIAAINGSLGIGTMSPAANLVIRDTGTPTLKIGFGGSYNNPESGRFAFDEDVDQAGVCGFEFRHAGDENKLHLSSGCTAMSTRVTFLRDGGNVGIGTENPTEKLTVAGTIESTSGGIKFPDASTLTSANNIDADLLDGLDSTAFASAVHNHTGSAITSGTIADARIASTIARDSELTAHTSRTDNPHKVTAAQVEAAAAVHSHSGADITSGTVADAQIASTIARDSEVSAHTSRTDNPHVVTAAQAGAVAITGDTMTGDLSVNSNFFVTGTAVINTDLYVDGNIYAESDRRSKEDIRPIESSLEKLISIDGIIFKWKETGNSDRQRSRKTNYGVIAQQVETVIPDIVTEGNNGKKKVAYGQLIPVMIEAIKEQQKTISELKEQNREILEKMTELEKEIRLKGTLASAIN